MKLKEMIAVMQAFATGEQIEYKENWGDNKKWIDCHAPRWNWSFFEYRAKPKEPRVFYIAVSTEDNCAYKDTRVQQCDEQAYITYSPGNNSCRSWDYIKVMEVL